MKKYVAIGMGGLTGACLRAGLKGLPALITMGEMSMNILLINLLGCFILSFFTTAVLELSVSPSLKLGIATGFCGALTTFSTLCKEGVLLMENVGLTVGIVYMVITVFCGLAAIYVGEAAANALLLTKRKREEDQC